MDAYLYKPIPGGMGNPSCPPDGTGLADDLRPRHDRLMSDEGNNGVRSLARGLALLEAMNRSPNASVTDLARNAGIPRSTAYRLLDTLVDLGFVTILANEGYALTPKVRSLSDGFIDESWLNPAWREMLRLGREIVWPVTLMTAEAATMVNRRTTHELSSMSIDYGMSGKRFPITETAGGRCYLAFCSEAERNVILALPSAYIGGSGTPIEQQSLKERLELIRARGFETRIGGVVAKTGSLAVPVIKDDRVLCCISVIFIATAMSIEMAIERFERPLKESAARLVASLD